MELVFNKLEDGQDYFVAAETVVDNNKYYLFVNENEIKEPAIRKEVGDELVGLDDIKEFQKVIAQFLVDNKDNPELKKYFIEFNENKE